MKQLDRDINHLEDLIQKKDLSKANRLADSLLEVDTYDVRVLNLSARVKLLLGELKEAKWLAEMACVKDNCIIEAQYMLGFCHQRLGEFREAADAYFDIIKKAPSSAFAHFKLGESLNMSGKKEESIRAYRRAVELDRDGDIAALAEAEVLRLKEEN
ncbi:MAG: tetratricopeptide repeat protein [bacterium]|nr:tetratricopeptide repeat protein [bacterium]